MHSSAHLIVIEAWPLDDHSDPDMYVRVVDLAEVDQGDHEMTVEQLEKIVNYKNCKWKANTHGKKRLEITPFDANFKLNARYYIAAQPFRRNQNNFAVKLQLIEAKPIK